MAENNLRSLLVAACVLLPARAKFCRKRYLKGLTILKCVQLFEIFSRKFAFFVGVNCEDIQKKGNSEGDGMYWLDPDGGSHLNAFLAYCDMKSFNGGWTMCYTTDDKAKPRTEVSYSSNFPYGSNGYRTNCNNILVS